METYDQVEQKRLTKHYYGDTVRKLFIAGAVLMFIYLPLDRNLVPAVVYILIILALAITLFAGFTNPAQKWVITYDTVIAAIICLTFEFFAVSRYQLVHQIGDITFLTRQLLAINFLIALYFSSKSLRGLHVKE